MKTHAEVMAEHYASLGRAMPDEVVKDCAELDNEKNTMDVPEISFKVNGKGESKMEVECPVLSLITGHNKIWYFECMVTSDAAANGIKAALNDEIKCELMLKWNKEQNEDEYDNWKSMALPLTPRILHKRLLLDKHTRPVNLIAAIDTSADFFIVNNGSTLWKKLRDRMTTPTLEKWGEKIMTKILKSGLILQAKTFNLGEGRYAYILTPDAQTLFDEVVRKFVNEQGGF